ncbi:tRNA pseudouridine(38-40) synthase TruA [Olivibacter ginsenosidimutans]|uniref:tRNA pseudouridine(38-40) synthase TruA n=1 Tax=Olivibacter ginsenosidimutans TaxID=1176537 RepID=UPI0031EF7D37
MSPVTKRYFIELAFNGNAYHGWQIQPNALSVQQVVDRVLGQVLRQPVNTVGCGRTDTGVHAQQLFAHFDLDGNIIADNEAKVLNSINALLPPDIAAKNIFEVANHAHARFDAIKRSYAYYIHFNKNPFLNGLSWRLRDKPDITAMNEAAQFMMAYQDFSCFSKSHTQVFTNNCQLMHASWEWLSEERLVFRISADRFLRNMVRAIVGTLIAIGNGKQQPTYIHEVLQSKDRRAAGTSVPACGLYLTEVVYPWDLCEKQR